MRSVTVLGSSMNTYCTSSSPGEERKRGGEVAWGGYRQLPSSTAREGSREPWGQWVTGCLEGPIHPVGVWVMQRTHPCSVNPAAMHVTMIVQHHTCGQVNWAAMHTRTSHAPTFRDEEVRKGWGWRETSCWMHVLTHVSRRAKGLKKMFICCAAQRSAIHLFTPPTSASDLFESRVSGSSSEVASRARNSRSGSVLCATPKQ